ncbi:MAG: putative bifunctional diguanylate cyclase/phosphodiesterase [Methylococcales bacterium]
MLSRDDFFAELSRQSAHLVAGKKMGLILARVQRLGEINIIMDKELIDAAQTRIEKSLRPGDRVAKIGACDFIIYLADLKNVNHAALAANSLVRGFQEPLLVPAGPIQATIAMGVSIFPDHGDEPEILCKHAEIAFARALQSSDRYAIYDSHEEKIKILYPEFREAITNNRLEVYLQPFWDLRRKKVIGAESLARWKSPVHGFVSPDQFIPFAEQTGLIGALTRWSVNATLYHCSELKQAGFDLSFGINLSARVFHEHGVVEQILGALNIFDVPPTNLVLEVTESAIMSDLQLSARVLESLRDKGVRISIDDFGCGYSSFEYLKQFPATELKIDKSFVFDITRSARAAQLVRSMIDLAHHLDIVAIAEGVEDQETANMLEEMDCDFAQGYFYSRPKPAEQFVAEMMNL